MSADTTENTMPPIRGWTALRWGLTRTQVEKIVGNPVKPAYREYESAGTVTFYGYPAELQVVFDKTGGLAELDFDVISKSHADSVDQLNEIHGVLEADLGQPSIDGIGWVHPDGAYNTMWCSRSWTVFTAVGGSHAVPWEVIVQYLHRNACVKKHT